MLRTWRAFISSEDCLGTRCNATPMMEHEPWKLLHSKIVYENLPYVTVHSHTVELPDGRVVEPYFRIDLRSFVVMAAVTPDNRIVVERQYRHGIGQVSLMLPGGLLETGEDPLLAAKRELLEETGYAAEEWEPMGHFIPNSNYRCGETFLFLARSARKIAEPNDDDLEATEVIEIPLDDALHELRAGRFMSLSSAAALSLASARIKG